MLYNGRSVQHALAAIPKQQVLGVGIGGDQVGRSARHALAAVLKQQSSGVGIGGGQVELHTQASVELVV